MVQQFTKPKGFSFLDQCVLQFLPLLSSTDNDGAIEVTVFYKVLNGKIYIVKEATKFL